MCLLSLHLSGKSLNSASKGIGYDLTTLIGTRDVSTPRIESIFLHPKKSAKASVMASHSKLLLLLATRILRFALAANLVILSNDVSLNPGPAGPLPQVITNNLSDESFSLDGSTLSSSYSGLYDTFDSSVELDHCELYPLFDLGLDDKALRIGHWNVNHLTSTKFDQIKLFLSGESGRPQVDVLFLNEIFLKPDIPDSLYAVPGFTIYRCDRISI